MELKSIWDGWKKQCFGTIRMYRASCAVGYLYDHGDNGYIERGRAVGRYIQEHYTLPEVAELQTVKICPKANPWQALIYANDFLKLTPEEFREIDRRVQIDAAVKPLVDSAPESVEQGVAG